MKFLYQRTPAILMGLPATPWGTMRGQEMDILQAAMQDNIRAHVNKQAFAMRAQCGARDGPPAHMHNNINTRQQAI
jgi:hypothetical protein